MDEEKFVTIEIPDYQWVPQYIFGHLLRVASPIVEAYHCDFYRDAIEIRETFNITGVYYYYVGECGTYLLLEHNSFYGQYGRRFWFKIVKESK